MRIQDTAAVLAKAAIFDFRTVGEADIMAWHEIVGELDVTDALQAVTRWYRDRSDRLMPSHLIEAVALVRSDRRKALRLAAAEAEMQSPTRPAEESPGRRFHELPPEVQAELRAVSGGFLGREGLPTADEVRRERFGLPQNGSVYGED